MLRASGNLIPSYFVHSKSAFGEFFADFNRLNVTLFSPSLLTRDSYKDCKGIVIKYADIFE